MLTVAAFCTGIFGVSAKFLDGADETIAKCNKIEEALEEIGKVVKEFKLKADDFSNILVEGKIASIPYSDQKAVIDWNSQEVKEITKAANRLYDLLDD